MFRNAGEFLFIFALIERLLYLPVAGCWLKGETQVWLLTELARQCGYHFETEGIKVIEFAQSGLKPLLKYASRMGIEWHVLVDGDDAGKKYAETVRSFLNNSPDGVRDRLTQLPALDMENFMYREGFSDVYHQAAGLPANIHMPMRKVIRKAINIALSLTWRLKLLKGPDR